MTFLDFILGLLALLVIILVTKLIIMIFKHPLFGRIIGLIAAVVGFITGLNILKDFNSAAIFAIALELSILYTISYLCALGAGSDAFDTYWDGTYTLYISKDSIDLRENISGGFLSHLIGSIIIGFFLSMYALSVFTFLLWLVPLILALANIGLIIKVIRDWKLS